MFHVSSEFTSIHCKNQFKWWLTFWYFVALKMFGISWYSILTILHLFSRYEKKIQIISLPLNAGKNEENSFQLFKCMSFSTMMNRNGMLLITMLNALNEIEKEKIESFWNASLKNLIFPWKWEKKWIAQVDLMSNGKWRIDV